jgi:hypothetical protein
MEQKQAGLVLFGKADGEPQQFPRFLRKINGDENFPELERAYVGGGFVRCCHSRIFRCPAIEINGKMAPPPQGVLQRALTQWVGCYRRDGIHLEIELKKWK